MHDESSLQMFKRLGYTWTKGIEEEFKKYINEAETFLKEEAERCDCLKFLDDSALFEQFKQNLDYEEEYANIILCKILRLKLDVKVLRWQLGEYLFTDNDRTMIEYFCDKMAGKVLKRKAFRPENTFRQNIKIKCSSLYEKTHYYRSCMHDSYGASYSMNYVRESDFLNESCWQMSDLDAILLGEKRSITRFFNPVTNGMFEYAISEKEYNSGMSLEKQKRIEARRPLIDLTKKYADPKYLDNYLNEWKMTKPYLSYEEFLKQRREELLNGR